MFVAMVALSVTSQVGSVTVAEGVGEAKLFVLGTQQVEIDLPYRRSGGTVGWSFDLAADCRLVIAKSRKESTSLELHRVDSRGNLELERILAVSNAGISSPLFSPDGNSVAYIDGGLAVVLELKSGVKSVLGEGRAAMWDEAGGVVVWRIDDKKCQVLERYADGSKKELDHQCLGEITRPVSSGVLPKGAPLPTIGRYDVVESLLGTKSSSSTKGTALRGAGVACKQGIVYVTPDGAPVSIVKNDLGWSLVNGSVCERPVAQVDVKVMKTQQCSTTR